MKYIGLALYSEGRKDDYFLPPLLWRLCDHLCLAEAREPVEFSDVVALADGERMRGAPREERILEAARDHDGAWQILFIHGDGESDPEAARRDRVTPGIHAIGQHFGPRGQAVGVVPVRETESWMLHDGGALRSVFGISLSDGQMQLPGSARAVESVHDPKRMLDFVFQETRPSGARLRRGVSPHLGPLGDQVDLIRLQELPSFRLLVEDLRAALRALHVIA